MHLASEHMTHSFCDAQSHLNNLYIAFILIESHCRTTTAVYDGYCDVLEDPVGCFILYEGKVQICTFIQSLAFDVIHFSLSRLFSEYYFVFVCVWSCKAQKIFTQNKAFIGKEIMQNTQSSVCNNQDA